MKSFPLFFNVADRLVAIVGGGEAATQKARLIGKTEARVRVIAPSVTAELAQAAAAGHVEHVAAHADRAALEGAVLAFICTGCAGADAALAALARDAGAVVNVVDRPALCDATTPAIVDRDPLVVAIGTEGAAPVLARRVKTAIEATLEPGLGRLTAFAGALRDRVAQRVPFSKRRAFWAWVFGGGPRETFARDEAAGRTMIEAAIDAGGAPSDGGEGRVSLVGAGPGAADLVTLRAVKRLQEADVVFYDRLVDPSVLELARRDAERVYVGKSPGCAAWPQEKINALIVAAAQRGERVVRLKSGDPLVFGRAAEEASACEAAGVAWEVIPGVTAAIAAAGAARIFPTERGATDQFALATATGAPGAPSPDLAAKLTPGTTTAFYMCVGALETLEAALARAGAPRSTSVVIVEACATARQRVVRCDASTMLETARHARIAHPAIVFVTWPKDLSAVSAPPQTTRPTLRLVAGDPSSRK